MLNEDCVPDLLREIVFPQCRLEQKVSLRELPKDSPSWFRSIWRYINKYGILKSMKGIPIIPIGTDKDIREAVVIQDKTLVIYSMKSMLWFRFSKDNDEVLSLFRDLGFHVVDSLPSYVLQNKGVLDYYILEFKDENLPLLLQNLSCKIGKDKLVNKFRNAHNKEAKLALSQKLGCLYLYECRELIKALPMIENTVNKDLVSVASCRWTAPKELPAKMPSTMLLKARDDSQISLIRDLGGEQLTPEGLIEELLLSKIENERWLNADDDSTIEYIFSQIRRNRSGCDKIIERLQKVKFVTSNDGMRHKPCELFHPDKELEDLFMGEKGRFPDGKFTHRREDLEVLLLLGLKRKDDISPDDIKKCLDTFRATKEARAKALSILEFVGSNQRLLRDKALKHKLITTPLISILNTRPYAYPKDLRWYGEGKIFMALNEVYFRQHANLVGCTRAICSEDLEDLKAIKLLKQNTRLEAKVVVEQLNHVVKDYKNRAKHEFVIVLKEIYRYFQECVEVEEILSLLEDKEWVWVGGRFVTPQQIIVDECKLDLQPHLYKLPDESKGLASLLPYCGAISKVDKNCLIDVLHRIKRLHDKRHQSVISSERDRKICKEILTDLSHMELSKDDLERIIVPVHCDNEKLKLVAPHEAVYSIVRGHTVMDEECSETFFLDESISEGIAKAFDIKSYKNKLLGAESIGEFEDYGQSEPLTKRIKEIIKDYGDGSAIFKELIQNADDAGATEVKFLYDERLNEDKKKSLIDPCLKEFQGSALWAYNNAKFSEEDFQNLIKLGGAAKDDKRDKIGKFGLGFNAVYNITDVPSFISDNKFAMLDPHATNLASVINKKPGVKIPLNRLKGYKDQLQIYDGVFGMDTSPDNIDEGFHGTLFRFPLRTQQQAQLSEIKKLFYNKQEMMGLLQKFASEANKLLLFTQNINRVEIFHLDVNMKRADAMEPLLSISKEIFLPNFERGVLRAIPCESFDILSKSSEIARSRGLWKKEKETEDMFRNVIDVDTTIAPKGRRDFKLTGSCGKETWFVYSLIDKGKCMSLATKHKKLNPVASIAAPIAEQFGNTVIREASEETKGFFFCSLPIPMPNGLNVHVNSTFALKRDRRSFEEQSQDDKVSDTLESKWNRQLMSGPVPLAYVGVLKDLTSFICSLDEESWYKLWPQWNAVNISRHNQEMIRKFYHEVIKNDIAIFLGPRAEKSWLNWSHIRIIKETSTVARELMEDVCNLFHKDRTIVHLPPELIVTMEEAGFDHDLVEISISFEDFFTDVFMPNIKNSALKAKDRDDILLLALQKFSEIPSVAQSMRTNDCIPTMPFGDLKRPSELVKPTSKAAELFEKKDSVFPTEKFQTCCEELKELGMVADNVTWQLLEERAKTVKDVSATNRQEALKRTHRVLKIMSKRFKMKMDVKSAKKISWANIEFLPVKGRPPHWQHLEWEGENSSKGFASAEQMYHPNLKNIVGCHKLIIDEKLTGEINKDVETLLGINTEITIDDVIKQIQLMSESVKRYKSQKAADGNDKNELLEVLPSIFSSMYQSLSKKANGNPELERQISERFAEQPIILTKDNSLVKPSQVAFGLDFDAKPYLFELSDVARRYKEVMKMLAVKENFDLENYQDALSALKDDLSCLPLNHLQMKIVRFLLESIKATKEENAKESCANDENCELQAAQYEIFLPDRKKVLQPIESIVVKEAIWMQEDPSKKYLHEFIPSKLALALGAKTARSDSISAQSRGLPFGQKEKLTVRLNKILQAYPADIQILYELLQNADDAGASQVKLVLDQRYHPTERVFGNKWRLLQGPALLVYNDAPFSERDIKAIQNLGEGSKSDDCKKIGQYGIGFNVVYHVTDAPCLLTKVENDSRLCVFDPNTCFLEECTLEQPGRMFVDARKYLQQTFPDIYNSFLPGFLTNENSAILRLPLRTCPSSIKSSVTTEDDIMKMFERFKLHGPEAIIFLKSVQSVDLFVFTSDDKPKHIISIRKELSKAAIEASKKISKEYRALSQNKNNRMKSVRDHSPVQCNVELGYFGKAMKTWTIIQKCSSINPVELKQSINREYEERNLPLIPFGGIAHCASEGNVSGRVFCSLPLTVSSNLPVHINGNFILEYESRRRLSHTKEDSFQKDWNCYVIESCIIPCYFELLQKLAKQIVFKASKENFTDILLKAYSEKAEHPKPVASFFKYFPTLQQDKTSHEYESMLVKAFYVKLTENAVPVMPVVSISSGKLHARFLPPNTETEQFYIPDFSQENNIIKKQAPKICIALNSIGMHIYNVPPAIRDSFCQSKTPLRMLTPEIVVEILRKNSKEILKGRGYLKHQESVFKELQTVAALLLYCMKDKTLDLHGIPLLVTEDGNLRQFDELRHVFYDELSDLFPTKKGLTLHMELRVHLRKYENKETGPLRKFMLKDLSEIMNDELPKKYKNNEEIEITNNNMLPDLPSRNWLVYLWRFLHRNYEHWRADKVERDRVAESKDKPRKPEDMGVTLEAFLKPIANWCLFPVKRQGLHEKSSQSSFLIKIETASTAVIPGTDIVMNALVKEIGLPVPSQSFSQRSVLSYFERDSLFPEEILCKLASPMHNVQALIAALKHENNRINTGFSRLSLETARDFLYRLQRDARDITETEKQTLRELPVWQDIFGSLKSVSSARLVYLISKSIPDDGLRYLQQKYDALLIKEDGNLMFLYRCLRLKTECDSQAYCELILKHFEELEQDQRKAHLEFLKGEFKGELGNALLGTLKKTKIIEKNGILSLAGDFSDPEIEIFKELLPETEFPPKSFHTPEWLNFLRKIGLVCNVSTDIFCNLAIKVSKAQNEEKRRRKSKALVDYLKRTNELNSNDGFLDQISTIPFLVPDEVQETLSRIFQGEIEKELLCFKGAIAHSVENILITWTVKSILPSYTLGLNQERLGIKEKVENDIVIRHIVNVSQSELLQPVAKGVKRYPDDLKKYFRYIFKAAYNFFSESRDNEVFSSLRRHPIIFVASNMLSVARKVTQEVGFDMPPYLFSMPPKLDDFTGFFTQIGMSIRPTMQQLVSVLICMNSDTEGEALDPNETDIALKTLHKMIKIVDNEELPTDLEFLPLPGTIAGKPSYICLHESQELIYFDDLHLEKRLTKLAMPRLYVGDQGFSSTQVINFIKELPPNLRTKILSDFIKEKMQDAETMPNQGFANELQCRIRSDPFTECIARLLKHQNQNSSPIQSLDEITESFSRIQVITKTSLTTVLYHSDGIQVEGSEADKDVFIEKLPDTLNIYLKSSLTDKIEAACIITSEIVSYLATPFNDPALSPHITMLLTTDNESNLHKYLDKAGIWRGDAGDKEQSRIHFTSGDFVPLHLYCLLNHEIEKFGINERAAYEIESQDGQPAYIYVNVLEYCTEEGLEDCCKIDCGPMGEEIVHKTKLYGFRRPVSLQQDDEETYDNLEEEKDKISHDLEAAFRQGEEYAKREIKRLWLKWHPDRNRQSEEFSTEIFNFIQSETERIRKRSTVQFNPVDIFWSALHRNSARFKAFFRNQRSQGPSFPQIDNPQPEEAKRWHRQAKCDLEAVRSDLRDDNYEWACFKCHQVSDVITSDLSLTQRSFVTVERCR